GPVVRVAYRATVDRPAGFRNSKAVVAVFWIDAFQVSVGRDQPNRRDIKVRGRNGTGDALRSSSDHAGAYGEVVLAQGLGHEDRQAPRDEEGNRGAGAPVGGDHAPHLVDGT